MIKKRLFKYTVFTLFLFSTLLNAEVYRWTDKSGNIHFSDRPHRNSTQVEIKAPKSAGIGISKKQVQRQNELLEQFHEKNQENHKKALLNKKQQAERDRYCTRLKNQLRNYEEVDYLFTRDQNGEKKNLTEQQKRNEEDKVRRLIEERC